MKTLLLIFVVAFTMLSCVGATTKEANDDKSKPSAPSTKQDQRQEYTSKFICPMNCPGSGAEEQAQCAFCGMDYVLNERWNE